MDFAIEIFSAIYSGQINDHLNIMELLMLVYQPRKSTLNGIIHIMAFATLNGVRAIPRPKWRGEQNLAPKWCGEQNLTLNGVVNNVLPYMVF